MGIIRVRKGPWLEKETNNLLELIKGLIPTFTISLELGRSEKEVIEKISELTFENVNSEFI